MAAIDAEQLPQVLSLARIALCSANIGELDVQLAVRAGDRERLRHDLANDGELSGLDRVALTQWLTEIRARRASILVLGKLIELGQERLHSGAALHVLIVLKSLKLAADWQAHFQESLLRSLAVVVVATA